MFTTAYVPNKLQQPAAKETRYIRKLKIVGRQTNFSGAGDGFVEQLIV